MTNNELARIICECTEILATTTTYAATYSACDLGTEDCNAAINGMGKMGARLDELRETINTDIQNEEQAKVHHPTTQAYEAALNHIAELKEENAKLRELVHKQDALTKAVHAYWAGGERSLDEFNVMMDANAQVLALMQELGIEVPE